MYLEKVYYISGHLSRYCQVFIAQSFKKAGLDNVLFPVLGISKSYQVTRIRR